MACLLHIDTSVDLVGSTTRRLSAAFVRAWSTRHPEVEVRRRDLGRDPAPPLSCALVRAVKAPEADWTDEQRNAWRVSEALSTEFLAADRYVVGMPMHILTVPSSFKAYVEQIFHRNRVFRVDENGHTGLLGGRKVLVFVSRGADYRAGAPLAGYDVLEPYLVKLFTFCGVAQEDITFVALDNALAPGGPDTGDEAAVVERIEELAGTW